MASIIDRKKKIAADRRQTQKAVTEELLKHEHDLRDFRLRQTEFKDNISVKGGLIL